MLASNFREIHSRLRNWQGLEGTTASLANGLTGGTMTTGSVSGHSGSQHSSTGPSNNTGSTNLSSNPPHLPRPYHTAGAYPPPPTAPPHSPAYSTPYQGPPPPVHPGSYPRLTGPVSQGQPIYLAQRSNAIGGSPVTIRINQPNIAQDTQLANL